MPENENYGDNVDLFIIVIFQQTVSDVEYCEKSSSVI